MSNLDDETKRELVEELDTINDQLLDAAAEPTMDVGHTLRLLAFAQAAQLRTLAMLIQPPVNPDDPRQLTLPWGGDGKVG